MKKKILIFLVMLLVLSLFPVTTLYAAPPYTGSISYIGAAWDHDPLTVYVTTQKGVDSVYLGYVQTALNDWHEELASGNSAIFKFVSPSSAPTRRSPADITINIKKNTGAVLGSTKISASGGVLKTTSITLASKNAMGQALNESDFRNILRHELGHALGLGHATASSDLMYPYYDSSQGENDVTPSNLDIDALIHIYGSDGFGGTNSSIPSSFPMQ